MNQPLIIVPGWLDSEPAHWQSLWEKKFPCQRVFQKDWLTPQRQDWVTCLEETIFKQKIPPVLIAHSMGCLTSVIVGNLQRVKIAGAFLVSPVDLELLSTPSELKNFLPTPLEKLNFPTQMIASENDPYCSIETARKFAHAWGSQFISIGHKGHINVATGFGEWAEGEKMLKDFLKTLIISST